ncbi:hypothetical protein ABPG77_001829 [Micractinium sp. CCAP 211/92]
MLQLVLLLLALAAGPSRCQLQGGAPRALLQAQPNCSSGFQQAFAVCIDATQRLPGSRCCRALAGLGADCLGMVAASLRSDGRIIGTSASQLSDTLQSCHIQLNGPSGLVGLPPTAASSPAGIAGGCAAGFAAAVSACGSGPDCCDAVQELGAACLQELEGASTGSTQIAAYRQVALDCGLGAANGTDADPPQLPEGQVLTWWRWRADSVVCADYRGGRFVNATDAAPAWVATGTDTPREEELISLGERWCRDQDSAVDDIFSALEAGGHAAQVAQATVVFYKFGNGTRLWDKVSGELIADPRLSGPDALSYLRSFVAAADRSGVNFCITAVVVSNVTGAVLYKEAVHVGPSAASPQGCPPAFQQLKAFCGSYAAAPPDYCCDELAALGSTCLDTLGSTLDADDLAALDQLSQGCSSGPANPAAPPGGGAAIPAGTSTVQLNTGAVAACSAYDAATGWSELGNSSWAAARVDQKPSPADIQSFALQMCPLAGAAGPLLLRAVEAGGQRARVAVACIVAAVNPGTCANETARAAARAAFLQAVVNLEDPERQLSVMQAFVDACDTMGAGACASLAVYRPDAGQVLYQTSIHTAVDASLAAARPPSVARRLLRCSPSLPSGQTTWGVLLGGCLA